MKILLKFISIFVVIGLFQCKSYEGSTVYKNLKKAAKHGTDVKYLCLSDKKLNKFPVEILSFSNLETLILSSNNLDSIPDEIRTLKHLKVLNLMGNPIRSLPESMVSLKELDQLFLVGTLLKEKDIKYLRDSLPNCTIVLEGAY